MTRVDSIVKPNVEPFELAVAHNLREYARLAGIEQIHLHQLRPSFVRMGARSRGYIEVRRSGRAKARRESLPDAGKEPY